MNWAYVVFFFVGNKEIQTHDCFPRHRFKLLVLKLYEKNQLSNNMKVSAATHDMATMFCQLMHSVKRQMAIK